MSLHVTCTCMQAQGPEVTSATLLDVAGAVPDSVTQSVMRACRSGSFSAIQTVIADCIAEGWPVSGRQYSPSGMPPMQIQALDKTYNRLGFTPSC